MTKSRRSVNSTNTDSSRSTVVLRKNTDHTEFVYFNQQIVVARKHTYLGRWSENEESEFRKVLSIFSILYFFTLTNVSR